jgi:hypothetical protein
MPSESQDTLFSRHRTWIVSPWPEKFPPSFLSVAQDAAYRTAFIGKKHIYNTDEPLPGVDRWVSFVNQGLFVDPDVNIDGERWSWLVRTAIS